MSELTQSPYFLLAINFFLSLIVAQKVGSKKHIGSTYIFWFGVGFSFIAAWIISSFATPLNEPLKNTKKDVWFYLLIGFFLYVIIAVAFFYLPDRFKELEFWKPLGDSYTHNDSLFGKQPDYSFMTDGIIKKICFAISFSIGSLTGIVYLIQSSKTIENETANN